MYKQWHLSLDIMPTGLTSNWSNIVHVGIGGNKEKYGDRTPGIWFPPMSTKLCIASAINNNPNFQVNTTQIPINQWSHVEIYQIRIEDGAYQLYIKIDNTTAYTIVNENPSAFSNIEVFTSDNYYPAADADIKNLVLVSYPDNSTNTNTTDVITEPNAFCLICIPLCDADPIDPICIGCWAECLRNVTSRCRLPPCTNYDSGKLPNLFCTAN